MSNVRRRVTISMRVIFFLGFGLLPLWAALVFIAFAVMTMSSEHAGMTLWAIVPAFPACAVTLAIAAVCTAIYSRVQGDHGRKLLISGGFLSAALLLFVVAGGTFWSNKKGTEQDILAEKARAEEFARNNLAVRSEVGEPSTVSVNSYTIDRAGRMPTVYDVTVVGTKTVYAIVEVDRKTKPPTFSLRCTTPLYMGQREVFKSRCAQ